MNLVTVTCNRDFNQMLLQSESIQMHLDPCTHWVIVNERDPDEDLWRSALSPYYTNHTLKLLFLKNNFHSRGYFSQQTYKFWIFDLIKDDYLILDSKNFFLRKTSIQEWKEHFLKTQVHTFTFDQDDRYSKVAIEYAKYLGIPLSKSLRIHTPFLFEKTVLEKIENFNNFIRWFDTLDVDNRKSEFVLYSFLLEKYNMYPSKMKQMETWTYTCWPGSSKSFLDRLSDISKFNTMKAVGIHRDVINTCTDYELEYLNIWLSSRNFQNKIKRLTTT